MKKLLLLGIASFTLAACGNQPVNESVEADIQSSVEQKNIEIAIATSDGTDFDSNSYTTEADEENYMNLAGYTTGADTVYVIYNNTVVDYFETDDEDNAFLYKSRTNEDVTTVYLTTDQSLSIGDGVNSLSDLSDEAVQIEITPNQEYLDSESSSASEASQSESYDIDVSNPRTDLTYDDLMRYPDDNFGEIVQFSGTILQTIQGDGEVQHRVALNDDYDTIVLLGYDADTPESRIIDDDYITFTGMSIGTTTYETVMGAELEIPMIYAEEVTLN